MPRWKTQALILKTTDYLESDRIVCALTKDRGLINAIAKGARRSVKRFPGTLEPFCEVILEVFSKPGMDLLRLEEVKVVNANLGIREDIHLFAHASVLLEVIIGHLGPLDPHPETYQILSRALSSFSSNRRWFPLWAAGMINILTSLGYGLDVRHAISKGKPLPMDKLSQEARMFMERGATMDMDVLMRFTLSGRAQTEIEDYLLALCEKIADHPLKTAGFLARL